MPFEDGTSSSDDDTSSSDDGTSGSEGVHFAPVQSRIEEMKHHFKGYNEEQKRYIFGFLARMLLSRSPTPLAYPTDSPPEKKYVESEQLEDYKGYLEKDVRFVAQQADCPLDVALEAVVKNRGDIVNAVMDITC
jgi:NACalpha-BTF3-like transcription factor